MAIDRNQIPGAIYFDTSFTAKLRDGVEQYLSIAKLLDKDPVQIDHSPAIGPAPLSVNQSFYDNPGRLLRRQVHFKV